MPFQIVRNDITKMHVDAIVNTANPLPLYGAGIDSAVYEAAGKEKLLAERAKIGPLDPGTSVITDGFELPAKYIIHTVGTAWQGGSAGEEETIRKCYKSVFDVAKENAITSLAIPLLASGSYGFPKGIALRIALSEIEAFAAESDMDIYLVVFDEKSVSLSSELYGDIEEYINDNYVEEQSLREYEGKVFGSAGGGRDPRRERDHGLAAGFTSAFSERIRFPSPRSKTTSSFADEEAPGGDEEAQICDECAPGLSEAAIMRGVSAPLFEEKRSLDDVVKNLDKTFMELVFSFADEKGLTDVEVQKRANLDRKAFSKLKCGTTKNPSKSTALALAVALKLNLDETKDLLSRAGLALSPCSKQDVIVQYFIEREAYDIYEINVALFDHGEQILGTSV